MKFSRYSKDYTHIGTQYRLRYFFRIKIDIRILVHKPVDGVFTAFRVSLFGYAKRDI